MIAPFGESVKALVSARLTTRPRRNTIPDAYSPDIIVMAIFAWREDGFLRGDGVDFFPSDGERRLMPITQADFDAILADRTKTINGDIQWRRDDDDGVGCSFRAEISSVDGHPVFINGYYNPIAGKLSYVIIHRETGRVYGLDLGAEHHNPTCSRVGEKHKHKWTDRYKDKEAYVPTDITAAASDPVSVWKQFCVEASITHNGNMGAPPPLQEELLV